MAEDGEGLTGTDPENDGAGGDETIATRVDDGEFAGSEGEVDSLGCVGSEMDALETGERADGSAFDAEVGNVKLNDRVAGNGAGVGDASGDEDGRVAGEGGFGGLGGGEEGWEMRG